MESPSARTIRDYLLGQLPDADAERLDELSIADDECAERIRAVEYDLVDAYVRGELHGVVLEQFRARYLTNPRRLEATRFAEALQSLGEEDARDGAPAASRGPAAFVRSKRRWPERLALAAAVVVLATATAWLAFDNRTLRARATSAETARAALERDRELRGADVPRAAEAAPSPTARAEAPLTVATLVLSPQLRGARQLPALALGGATGDVAIRLDLEPVDYPTFTASLSASNGTQAVWQSDRLIASSADGQKTIDLRVPAPVLRPQEYLIRVSGVPARGASEIVGEYRFIVVK